MRKSGAMGALVAGAAILVAFSVTWANPQGSADGPPRIDRTIDDFTTGRCNALVESSLIHQPQIERVADFPRQRVVPIHKLPIPDGQRPEERGFSPRPRCYSGFSGVNDTGSTTAWIDIAVSDDDDPNGTWYKYRTDALTNVGSHTYWVDYPSLGFDDVGYYVTGNLFDLASGASCGAKYRCFDKTPLLTGGTATWNDLRDGGSFSVQSGEHHTVPNAPFFMSLSTSTKLNFQAIKTPLTTPQLVSTTLTVPSFSSPPDAPNLGGSPLDTLDTLDGRIINLDHRDKRLVCGHGVDLGNDAFNWYPALADDGNDEIGMSFAFSGANEYGGIAYATQKTTDPAGVMSQVVRVKQGRAPYNNTRRGDFFDCCPDPSDPTRFWGVGEWGRTTNSWGTWIYDFDSTWDPPTSGILMSLRGDKSVGGLFFTKGDVVHYDPTRKVWDMYFDLSDVLAGGAGNVDAFSLLPDGSLVMSFVAQMNIPGMTGGPSATTLEDKDLARFVPTSLGEVTTGTWEFYFDGSDVGLDTSGEDTDAVDFDAATNQIAISTTGDFLVPVNLSGHQDDLITFTATTLGSIPAGSWALTFEGSAEGLDDDIDAIEILP